MSEQNIKISTASWFLLNTLSLVGAENPSNFESLPVSKDSDGELTISLPKLKEWINKNTNQSLKQFCPNALFRAQRSDGKTGLSYADLGFAFREQTAEKAFIAEYGMPEIIIEHSEISHKGNSKEDKAEALILRTSKGDYFRKIMTEANIQFVLLEPGEVRSLEHKLNLSPLSSHDHAPTQGMIAALAESLETNPQLAASGMFQGAQTFLGRLGPSTSHRKSAAKKAPDGISRASNPAVDQKIKGSSAERFFSTLVASARDLSEPTKTTFSKPSSIKFGGVVYQFPKDNERIAYPEAKLKRQVLYQDTNECMTAALLNAFLTEGSSFVLRDGEQLSAVHQRLIEVQKQLMQELRGKTFDELMTMAGATTVSDLYPSYEIDWSSFLEQSENALAAGLSDILILILAANTDKIPGLQLEILPRSNDYYSWDEVTILFVETFLRDSELILNYPLIDLGMEHVVHVTGLDPASQSITVINTLSHREEKVPVTKIPKGAFILVRWHNREAFVAWLLS